MAKTVVAACVVFFSLVSASSAAAQSGLPAEVQADLLEKEIISLLRAEEFGDVLEKMTDYRKLAVPVPPQLFFIESRAANQAGEHLRSLRAMKTYLRDTDRTDSFYGSALDLYPRLVDAVEKQGIAEKDVLPFDDLGTDTLSGAWRDIETNNVQTLRKNGRIVEGIIAASMARHDNPDSTVGGTMKLSLQDDGSYKGTYTGLWICHYASGGFGQKKHTESCQIEQTITFDIVEGERIEGSFVFPIAPTKTWYRVGKYCKTCGETVKLQEQEFIWVKHD